MLLEVVLVGQQGAIYVSGQIKPQCPSAVMGTLCCRRCRVSDDTLNRGPDSLWSLRIP
uniref:Uncharacterized protein n=1 Tax=Anguilla anguilla TaxID=7936 RepID=A0A0E9TAZ2_ANGAN